MNGHRQPLLIGSGNVQFRDDGVGVYVVRAMKQDPPLDVTLLDAGTDVFSTLPYIEGTDHLLLVTTVRQGRPPGTLCVVDGYAIPYHLHPTLGLEIAIPELLQSLAPHARPRLFYLLGIEPGNTSYGSELSPPVRAILPTVVQTARRMMVRWSEAQPWLPDAEMAI